MNFNQFVDELSQRGVKLWAEGNQLRVRAPKGVLTPELRNLLTEYKADLLASLQRSNISAIETDLAPVSRERDLPLSFGQERLWFLNQSDPTNPFYNEFLALRLKGFLNAEALERSINEIIRRHEICRTTFREVDGQPIQVVAPTLKLAMPLIDLKQIPHDEREIEIQRLAIELIQRPFDLSAGPLLRVLLLQIERDEHIFIINVHHIVGDGWSIGIFFRELAALYDAFCSNKPSPLPKLPLQYGDFAHWQRRWLQGLTRSSYLAYWKEKLQGTPPLLELPTDRPRPPVQTFRGAHQSMPISKDMSEALANLSKQENVSLFMTLLATFQILLYRYTGQADICIGTPIANRTRLEIEGLIGFFVNTLVLRTDLSENPSFLKLLLQVREVALGAYAHQDLPFEQLVQELQPTRSLSYTPLFSVMFVFHNVPLIPSEFPGLTVSPFDVETCTAKFELTLSFENTPSGLIGVWEYNTDLFDTATIARMASHFQTLLEGIVAKPHQKLSDLPLLTDAERHQLLVEWNDTKVEYAYDKCVHQLFEAQVERSPDAVAVIFEGEQLTYRELNVKANQLAHYLRSLGVLPEVLVGLCVERSPLMLIGLLAILKAGGAYLPLDPEYPQERLSFMLEDSQVSLLLTQQRVIEKLPQYQANVVLLDRVEIAEYRQDNLIGVVQASNLANVIYTSGSTGKPKGVMVEHKGLYNLALAQIQTFSLDTKSRVLQFASFSFDACIWEILMSFGAGATLYLGTKDSIMPGQPLIERLRDDGITHITLPPSALAVLPAEQLPALQTIIVAGEACSPELIKLWSVGRNFFNAYGPTEASVCATIAKCSFEDEKVSIGCPIANTQVYILDPHLQPVPIGVPGELHIGGAGLARGYLNRSELTTQKFIPNPFGNSKLYKTGDIGRYLSNGTIEYLGRIDNQVKIRGFRIELGEIETLLNQHPDILAATVIDREETPTDKRLVAYVVSNLIPERIPYHTECQLEIKGNALKLQTQDISTDSIGLVGVSVLDEGSSVHLHLQLPGEDEPRWLSGTVVWSHPPKAGVRFNLTPSEQALVGQSVAYQLDTQELWKTLQRTLTGSLRDYLKQKLPDYMIPSAFVLMKALPLTPNGKVDRRALPAPDIFHNEQEDKFVAPHTPTEAKLAAIWAEVLGVQQVSINDNFFELGGHSLLATQIISRIQQAFAIKLPLRHLFEAPTIASLSESIETALALEDLELFSYSTKSDSQTPLAPATREGDIPLSFSQEYIWQVQQLSPHSCGCNSGIALSFTLQLSNQALEKSLNEIIRRHEILRSSFPIVDGQPVHTIATQLTLPLNIVDLQNIPSARREAEAVHFAQREMNYHFDLANGPLIKATLVRLSSEEHWLLILMHHLITDGWSIGLFVQELETLYTAFSNGLPSPLPEVPLQYADFTIWQRQQFNEEVLAQQLSYWRQKLVTPEQQQEYLPPQDSKSNSSRRRAASYSVVLEKNLVASLKALSHSQNVTVPTILIVALKLLLFKWSGQSEILIVATIGNRSTPEIEKMLGCFINDVILRSQLDDDQTGVALLEQVKETLNEAISNKEIPLQQVIDAVQRQRKLPLSASVTIVPPVQGFDRTLGWGFAPVPLKNELWDEDIPLELYISLPSAESKTIEISVFYSRDLLASETLNRLFSYYQEILQKLASSPEMKLVAFERFQENNQEGVK